MKLSAQQKIWLEMNQESAITLDLHYHHLADIENVVEKFLNDSFLDKNRYLIFIHGHGTGALKNKLQEILKNHPLIEESWLASHGGCTYVSLDIY